MGTANLEQQLLEWKFVTSEQEHEKYFRYAAFKIKWLKITRQRDKVLLYINSFIENSHRGIDVVVSLVSLIKSTNDEAILAELLEAATVISDRNLKGLTKKEIAEAEKVANAIWKRAVFEESYHEALGD